MPAVVVVMVVVVVVVMVVVHIHDTNDTHTHTHTHTLVQTHYASLRTDCHNTKHIHFRSDAFHNILLLLLI